MEPYESILVHAAAELADQGWTTLQDLLPATVIDALYVESQELHEAGRFREAGVGRGNAQAVQSAIRKDEICWLDERTLTPPQAAYWQTMEAVRLTLNRELYLSLAGLEAHYAIYAPGAYYSKHVDRFRSADERVISTTLYLNPDWNMEDGGQLRLFTEERHFEVFPTAGTFTLFRSDTVPHEVLPAARSRYSLTGWFRRRSLLPF